MVINISIHNFVKNYSCHNVYQQKEYQYFDVLTFIQMRTDENKLWQIERSFTGGINAHTKE